MPTVAPPSPRRARFAFWLREGSAVLVWSFSLLKLFAFDLDVFVLRRLAPAYAWLLDFKLLFFLALVSAAWLLLGQRSFLKLFAYVAGYPFVLLFWRLPRVCFRHWPIAITFAPALYLALKRFRSTLVLYTIALTSAAVVLFSTSRWPLSAAILGLFVFQAGHLVRSLREAFGASLFADLARVTRKAQASVLGFLFKDLPSSLANVATDKSAPADPLLPLYITHSGADIIAQRVAEVVKTRKYDVYLVASWLYTVVVTAIVYALLFSAVSRLDPAAFASSAPLSLFRFLQLSIGILTTAGGSGIQAVSPLASVVSSSEYLHIPVLLIILVFTMLTTQRETYRQDADDFRLALQEFSGAIEAHIAATYQITAVAFEVSIHKRNAWLVTKMRSARGAPALVLEDPPVPEQELPPTPPEASAPPEVV